MLPAFVNKGQLTVLVATYQCLCSWIQLDGADILHLTVRTLELTLTLLEVPSLARGPREKCHASCCCDSLLLN